MAGPGSPRRSSCPPRPLSSSPSLLDAIEAAVLAHAAGREQADDITLLAVRRSR